MASLPSPTPASNSTAATKTVASGEASTVGGISAAQQQKAMGLAAAFKAGMFVRAIAGPKKGGIGVTDEWDQSQSKWRVSWAKGGASRFEEANLEKASIDVRAVMIRGHEYDFTEDTVNFEHEGIEDDDVVIIAAVLASKDCSAKCIDLDENQISDAGASSLAIALSSKDCSVTEIHLYRNQISNVGASSLATALSSKGCSVTTIFLGGNQISNAGASSLATALSSKDCSVTWIDLNRNPMSDAYRRSVDMAIKQRT